MKVVLFVALALLVVLAGLPLMGGMAMPDCPHCHLSPGAGAGLCLAVLAAFLLLVPGTSSRLLRREEVLRPLLLRAGLERPPRLA